MMYKDPNYKHNWRLKHKDKVNAQSRAYTKRCRRARLNSLLKNLYGITFEEYSATTKPNVSESYFATSVTRLCGMNN